MNPWAADPNQPLTIEEQFMALNIGIALKIEVMAEEAFEHLDDMTRMFQVVADYEYLRFKVLQIMPLGIQTFVDKRCVEILADAEDLRDIAPALIEELILMGSRNALNRLNRALASIIEA
jgi:hypothetical protein